RNRARMQLQLRTEFLTREPATAKLGKQTKLDRGEQDLGMPKAESGLQDGGGIERGVHKSAAALLVAMRPRTQALVQGACPASPIRLNNTALRRPGTECPAPHSRTAPVNRPA